MTTTMIEKQKFYTKYFSNGELPELNKHYCIGCHKLQNNMDIFVIELHHSSFFDQLQAYTSMGYNCNMVRRFKSKNYYNSLAKDHGNQLYLCSECIMKMNEVISDESKNNIVVSKI
jgi:hypothetical protein